ncbi:MAG: HEPN domain-containing protein [Chloroflexota bacterium]|nr:HEPN domain-containing protein [Chloroflexota bacterium]
MSASTLVHQLEARIRQELPSLNAEQAVELAGMIDRLVQAFEPECVYAFGSQARGDATSDSDVDLMLVIEQSDEPSYRRAQAAHSVIGRHQTPLDILIWTRDEFERAAPNPATLPGTILREGKLLYAPLFLADVEEWLIRAEHDLQCGMLDVTANPGIGGGLAFHAQQAAEKALRGYLTAHGKPFGKTHILELLISACEAIDPRFRQFTPAAQMLTPYAVDYWCVERRRDVPEAEVRAAFQHVTEILEFVRGSLTDAGSPPHSN